MSDDLKEAVNAVEPRYAPYRLKLTADRDASKEAAAASAGYEVLVNLHPDQKARLDTTLAAALAAIPDSDLLALKRVRPRGKGYQIPKA